jgi:HAD superfamily hydrolase (TIGR01490 family)
VHGYLPSDAHKRIKDARMQWKMRSGQGDFADYELVLVKEYLTAIQQITPDQVDEIIREVFEEYKDQTYVYTRNLIRELKEKGYTLVAISGSPKEIVTKLAVHHGFDISLGASFEQIDGKYSGKIDSPIFDKAKALQQLVDEHGLNLAGSIGVGDSKSDGPMLAAVDHAIAFNPNQELFELAKEQGWKVVVERKDMVYELKPHDGHYVLLDTA